MHIVSRRRLKEFWEKEKEAEKPLDAWYRTAKKANWKSIADVREIYPHADLVGGCVIFNIGGNKYRLITKFGFLKKTVYIKFVLTHKQYDKAAWINEC